MPYGIEYYGGPADGRTTQYHSPDDLLDEIRIVQSSGHRAVYRLIVKEINVPAEFEGGKSTVMDFAYQFTNYIGPRRRTRPTQNGGES